VTRWCRLEASWKSFCYESFRERSFDVASISIERPGALLSAVVVLVTGCATPSTVGRLGTDLTATRTELGTTRTELGTTRAELSATRGELSATRAELDELRRAQDVAGRELARVERESAALRAKLADVSGALAESRAEVSRLHARLAAVEAPAARNLAAPVPAVKPPDAPAVPGPRVPAPDPPGQTAERAYESALAGFRAQEHGQAVLGFLDFIARFPGHPLVPNAHYWIGEAYYAQHDYRQALAEFQQSERLAPKSPKAADALLKIGLCQRHLRDDGRARQTWRRLVQDFPRSEAAVRARALLQPAAGAAPR